MKTFRLFLALLIGLLVAASVSACSIGGTNHPAPAAAPVASSTPAPQVVENPLIKAFGGTVTYQDGASVTVTPGTPFQPNAEAAGEIPGQQTLKFTVTVKNGTNKPLDILAYSQATSGGKQASEVSDIANNVGGNSDATLLPGQSLSWDCAYSVANPQDVTFTYQPDFQYKTAIFTSQPKE